jgi:mono/diheme cytochrome c family protein
MSRAGLAVFASLVGGTFATALSFAQAPLVNGQVAKGEEVFAASCGNQYCHGAAGKGAQGPPLANVPMTPEHIRMTILEGRTGTAMAPFKDVLEPAQVDAVAAYVLSISSGGRIAMPSSVGPGTGGRPARVELPKLSTAPVAVGGGQGVPANGLTPFFDPLSVASCRSCHSYPGRGGPLGIDLALARKTPAEVFASLSRPRVPARGYSVITVTLADGTKLTGIRGAETSETLSVYDLAMPPVRRTFLKAEVAEIAVGKQGAFDHTRLGYTRQQLHDIAAMVGSQP